MEKFKEALKHSDIVKVVLTGVGETRFSSEEVSKYIEELERLAKIGKAIEKAYSKGAILIYDIEEDYIGSVIQYNYDETIDDILIWLESED
jgi:predicted house-cleaning NTP pyrophosphatase (Maf/HAM1 superfamily)